MNKQKMSWISWGENKKTKKENTNENLKTVSNVICFN